MRLSLSGIDCFTGMTFVDDIVLIAPTPNATRKLLAIWDDFAAKNDIICNIGVGMVLKVGWQSRADFMASAEREPIIGVWGLCPQWVQGRSPRSGAKPPRS